MSFWSVYTPAKRIGLVAGPIAFFLIMTLMQNELDSAPRAVLAVTAWVAIWWMTEALPIPATSLLPLVLLPLAGGLDGESAASAYGNPIVFMYMGGFMIAIAIEKWDLHKRMALRILDIIGTKSHRIVLGVMIATAFLSMWISNAATALMMLPIALALVSEVKDKDILQGKDVEQFNKALLLTVAYSASIGGLATIVGSVPNAVFVAMSRELLGISISFAQWFMFGFPITIVLLTIMYFYMTRVQFRVTLQGTKETSFIKEDLKKLGPVNRNEWFVLIVFLMTATLWLTRTFFLPDSVSDTTIAILGATLLFFLPSTKKGKRILEWEDMKRLPWGLLLLFGGGLSLARGFSDSGLNGWVGEKMILLDQFSYLIIVILLTLFILFATEIMSNTAVSNVVIPITVGLGVAIGINEPFGLMAAAALASSCAFMLPISTPPNAAVFSSDHLTIGDMIKTGFWLNLVSVVVIVLGVMFLIPLVF